MGDLGLGVGAPGHHQGRELPAPAEERVLHHDLRGGVRRVGELPGHAHVAGGVDAAIRGAQPVVDRTPRFVSKATPAASSPSPSTFGARPAATSSSSTTSELGAPVRALQAQLELGPLALHLLDPAAEHEIDAVAGEGALHDLGGVGVLALEHVGAHLEQVHPDAEALERLGELAADRPAADHREARGAPGELEDRLVRAEAGAGEPGYGRSRGARARRDHGAPEAQLRAGHEGAVRAGKARLAEEHVDAELAGVARRRVLVADARADAAHALHRVGEGLRGRIAGEAGVLRGGDHRLRGHAADVQAVAAHQVALDERDLARRGSRRPRRSRAPRCPRRRPPGGSGPRGTGFFQSGG